MVATSDPPRLTAIPSRVQEEPKKPEGWIASAKDITTDLFNIASPQLTDARHCQQCRRTCLELERMYPLTVL